MHRLIVLVSVVVFVLCVTGCKKPRVPLATCEATVVKMMSMQGEEMFGQMPKDKQDKWKGKFTELMITACKEDRWPDAVLQCSSAAKDKNEIDACGEKVSKDEQEKMMKRVEPFMQQMMADMQPGQEQPTPAAPPAPVTPSASASELAACDAYLAQANAYLQCQRIPVATLSAMRPTVAVIEASIAALRSPGNSGQALKAVTDTCSRGAEALRAHAKTMGCDAVVEQPDPAGAEPAAAGKPAAAATPR